MVASPYCDSLLMTDLEKSKRPGWFDLHCRFLPLAATKGRIATMIGLRATAGLALATLASLLAGTGAFCQQATPEKGGPPKINAVMELFTSQGCSSCPSADKLLESYTKAPDVLALSFAVDIWDNLGWKDTLANPKFTERQRAYAKMRHDGKIYTPQMVINGGSHAVGSQKTAIDSELARALTQKAQWVDISVRREGDHVIVAAPERAGQVVPEATLWLVTYHRQVDVPVTRGENSGQTLHYYNAVREMSPIGMWSGSAMTVKLPRSALDNGKTDAAAILLQQGKTGRIVGAAQVP